MAAMTRQSVGGEHTTPDEEHGAVAFALAPARRTVCHGREHQAEQRRRLAGTRTCKKNTYTSRSNTTKKKVAVVVLEDAAGSETAGAGGGWM
jgi:hypothetical protein